MKHRILAHASGIRSSAVAVTWAAAIVLAIACTDGLITEGPSPTATATAPQLSTVATLEMADRDPSPAAVDRILFDNRTSLQQTATLRDALASWGETGDTRPQWGFTTDMDGNGTHAFRVDWLAAAGSCTSTSPEISRTLPKPYPKQAYMQWKQRLGRTATGGGVGLIGQFDVFRPECGKGGRYIWMSKLDGSADRVEVKWSGPEPVQPAVNVRGTSTSLVPSRSRSFDPQAHVGEVLTHTLYVQAQSSPTVNDGVVRLWINGSLVLDQSGIATGPDAIYKVLFPWTSPAPLVDQSEYYWDILVWEPKTTPPPPTPTPGLVVTPASVSVPVGGTTTLSASLVNDAGETVPADPVTWTSADPTIATVSPAGLVTGVAAGAVDITASAAGKTASSAVTVTNVPTPVASVDVTPATANLVNGQTVQLTAVLKDAAGAVLTGRTVTWSSSNTNVVTVNASGLVTGRGVGTATVTASSEGKTGSATITGSLVPVASVSVTPATASVVSSGVVQLSAVVKDASGAVLTGRSLTWSSSDEGIASVSAAGLVTGRNPGTAQITATCEGKTAFATITVTAPQEPPSGGGGPCGQSWPSAVYAPMPASTGQAFYVSPTGSDGNPGTLDAPWKTLQKAFATLQPGQIAYLRAGTYGAKCATTTFSRAGTATAPITVEGYPGERAVLNGQVALHGSYFRLSHIVMEGPSCGSWGGAGKLGENLIHMDPTKTHHVEVSYSEVLHSGWHAGIAAGGDDIWILNNYIHDNGNFNDGSQYNTSHGIYYHNGTRGVVANNILEHNFAKGMSARYSANHVFVVNNTVVGNGRSGMDIAEDTHDWTFANNVVMNNGNVNGGVGIHTSGSSGGSTIVLINNVLWNNGTSGTNQWESNSTKVNNLVADPMLVNPTNSVPGAGHVAWSNDYNLRDGSPATDFASPTYAPPVDLRDVCRFQDGRPDAGAVARSR